MGPAACLDVSENKDLPFPYITVVLLLALLFFPEDGGRIIIRKADKLITRLWGVESEDNIFPLNKY